MFGYIYLVRNEVNGKMYIGQRSGSFDPDYFGSGVYLKNALNKYGRDNFEHVKVLQECNSADELDEAERFWIKEYDAVNSSNFYNLQAGGYHNGPRGGGKHSDHWKSLIADKSRNRVWNDSSRSKISNYVSGRVWMTNGEDSRQCSEDEIDEYESKGWYFGRPEFSEESRRKMSQSRMGKSPWNKGISYGKGEDNPFSGKTHSDNQKKKWSEMRHNMVWVNKDGVNTTIDKSLLDKYLEEGWTRGMIRKKRSSTTIESIAEEKYLSE